VEIGPLDVLDSLWLIFHLVNATWLKPEEGLF
jgi:hypothetical protein